MAGPSWRGSVWAMADRARRDPDDPDAPDYDWLYGSRLARSAMAQTLPRQEGPAIDPGAP
jgi:hypothetical protein